MSDDIISRLLADAWVEKHRPPETALQRLAREEAERRKREAERLPDNWADDWLPDAEDTL